MKYFFVFTVLLVFHSNTYSNPIGYTAADIIGINSFSKNGLVLLPMEQYKQLLAGFGEKNIVNQSNSDLIFKAISVARSTAFLLFFCYICYQLYIHHFVNKHVDPQEFKITIAKNNEDENTMKEELSHFPKKIKTLITIISSYEENPTKNRKLFIQKGHMMFCGKPGSGKTHFISQIVKHAKADVYECKLSNLISKMMGESSKNLNTFFSNIKKIAQKNQNKPTIVFLDEFDSIGSRESNFHETFKEFVNVFLKIIDDLNDYNKQDIGGPIKVITATNRPKNIDPAITREGRIGTMIVINTFTTSYRDFIYKQYMKKNYPDICNFPQVFPLASHSPAHLITLLERTDCKIQTTKKNNLITWDLFNQELQKQHKELMNEEVIKQKSFLCNM